MHANLTAAEVLSSLGSSPAGLTDAQVEESRAKYGWNELPAKKKSLLLAFFGQFNNVLVYILVAALVFSLAAPLVEGHGFSLEHSVDAVVILAILLLNAVLGFVQEYKAEEAIALLKKLTAPTVRVRRGGLEKILPSRELVPGDVVYAEAGDRISADGRLITVSHLEINESSLTGESLPASKTLDPIPGKPMVADQRNMAFAGTLVSRGSGQYVVTDIGLASYIGQIAEKVSETEAPTTPLQRKLQKLSAQLALIMVGFCVLVVLVGLRNGTPLSEMLLLGVSLAVAAVPEGLPAVVTVCLALGVRRMIKLNVLVRRLESLETLGSVTVICSDKTGTITQNRMKVIETWIASGGQDKKETDLLAQIAASCNRASLPDLGDPTEIGLLEYAQERGVERLIIDDEEVPFTSEEKYMQTRHKGASFLKGAPEKIMELAPPADRAAVEKKNKEMASTGLRVLACAVKEGGKARFIGLVAMEDPPRPGVAEALADAESAGIRTIMITGDNRDTAAAIAKKVGIRGDAMDGHQLDALDKAGLVNALKTVSVFARVSPMHKVAILEALQSQGEIVAMSGDGVNDASALKGAHVGIAMGKNGTEVAREAGSIVLTDDNYVSIIAAVREGRRIYDNIRKFVLFLLQANMGELFLLMITTFLKLPTPLLALQILWINLMTDSLPALALSMEPEEPDIMQRPPRSPNETLLTGEWGMLLLSSLWMSCFAFVFFLWQMSSGETVEVARSTTFTLVVVLELLLVFNVRSRHPFWKIGLLSNRWLVGAVAVPIVLQMLVLYTPLNGIFSLQPLSLLQWGEILAIGLSGFFVFELLKATHRPRKQASA